MLDTTKPWYLSRTIWSGLTTTVVALLIGFGALPENISTTIADESALVLLGMATIYSRVKATKAIAPVIAPVTTDGA